MFRRMVSFLRDMRARANMHPTLITVEVSESRLLQNLNTLRALAPSWGIAPVLKSNAYGHGLVLVAHIFEKDSAIPFFAVDSYFEARTLRDAAIRKPLVVLGHTPTDVIRKNRHHDVSFVVASHEQLEELQSQHIHAHVHLKFDIGMHRRGMPLESMSEVSATIDNSSAKVEGIMSHFSDADSPGSHVMPEHIERWNTLARYFQKHHPQIRYYHVSNSAGFAYASSIVANVGRPGIALYGLAPEVLKVDVKPVCRVISHIAEIVSVGEGEAVGYNGTFTTRRPSRIAVVPAGYFEGIDRHLSNKGFFSVMGKQVPIVGRVNMNMTSCDVTDVEDVGPGTLVTLIGNETQDSHSVAAIARQCEAIPYEILVHIPAHLRRVVVP